MQKLVLLFLLLPLSVFAQVSSEEIKPFKNESELSYIQTGGNSEVATINAKTTNWVERTAQHIRFGGHYIYGESKESVSARNWDANFHYDMELNPRYYLILGEVIEGNRFTNIKARYNSDIGIKYFIVRTDPETFFSELGYRYTIEDRYEFEDNLYENKGRLYVEYSRKASETVQYRFWLEYIPSFTYGTDYLINGEASVISILTSMFSLKVGYIGNYDNLPATPDLKMYDYAFTTSLVAKF